MTDASRSATDAPPERSRRRLSPHRRERLKQRVRKLGRRARIQHWVREQAERRGVTPMLFFLSFTDSCISPVMPEVLLVPLLLSKVKRPFRYAFWCSLASVLGGILGYYLGYALWEIGLGQFFFDYVPGVTQEGFDQVGELFGGSAFLAIFLAGFTPLPYKLFSLAAGVFHAQVPFETFVLASATSRTLRFYVEVWLIARFGPPVLRFFGKKATAAAYVLAILAIAAVVYLSAR
jgi:membrane protein YqaA with SNARE-associated domain